MQNRSRIGKIRRVALATGLAAMSVARAEEAPPLALVLSQSLTHESNVLAAPQAVADTWSSTGLRLSLDQPVGRQRLRLTGQADLNRYRGQDQLDNTGYLLSGQLDWSTAERLQGDMTLQAEQHLSRVDQAQVPGFTGLNLERNHSAVGSIRLGQVTEWTFALGWSANERSFSADEFANRNLRRAALQIGARYQPSPDLSWTPTLRRSRGEYPDYTVDRRSDVYDRNDLESALSWQVSGASLLQALLTWSDENHSQQTARSQKLWSGVASWEWKPTGKLEFLTRLSRSNDTGTEALLPSTPAQYSDARLENEALFGATWLVTSKVKLNASLRLNRRDLDSAFNPQAATRSARDNTRILALGFSVTPWRTTQLGCSASDLRRTVSGDAGDLTFPYSNRVVSCFGQFGWS